MEDDEGRAADEASRIADALEAAAEAVRHGGEQRFEVLRPRVSPPQAPTVPRFYETMCVDLPGSGAAVWISSIPQPPEFLAAWQDDPTGSLLTSLHTVSDELGALPETLRAIRGDLATLLVPAILSTRPDRVPTYRGHLHAWEREHYEPEEYVLNDLPKFAQFVKSADPLLHLFAVRLAYEPLVPVERSAAKALSLMKLCRDAGVSAGLCHMTGFSDPVVVVVTPFMVVVLRAAGGIGSGLQEGLHRRIVKRLTGTDPGAVPDDPPEDDGDAEDDAG
jgi:hypothetical protein